MKTSITKLKSSLYLSLTFISLSALAKPVAQVTEVKGQVFVITAEGKTNLLRANDHLEEKSEVMVGEDGDVTLNDYYDATYHLIEGAHLKFFNKSVQLKKGKTWIQSQNASHSLVLTTANGHVEYKKGEFITTFDQGTSKTQVLVVTGDVEVSNVLDKNMRYTVAAGTFTVLDPESENGMPRSPTKVGLTSLNNALAEFKALPEKFNEEATASRAIASVSETSPAPVKGQIIFMSNGTQTNRFPASASGGAHKYFKTKVKHKKQPATAVPIRFYGMNLAPVAVISPRQPASVKPLNVRAVPQKVGSELNIDTSFADSLRIEKASQPNHPKDLERLIQDLKSY
ncbi:MAG: hypothetical protein H0V66_11660 [Bdellovibrionales bacterium]|nr:hypothetical protein [Bdellovibrionales bacterium]